MTDASLGNVFFVLDGAKVMWLCPNGDVFIRGEKVDSDPRIIHAFHEMLQRPMTTHSTKPKNKKTRHKYLSLSDGDREVIRFDGNDIFVRGEKVDDNRRVYDAFRAWLRSGLN